MAKFTTPIKVDCPRCDSESVIKHGRRNGHQVFKYKDCSRKFANNGTAARRTAPAAAVGAAINMYYDGLSIKRIPGLRGRFLLAYTSGSH